jgi:DNA-binding MarR family transcriptional regulator
MQLTELLGYRIHRLSAAMGRRAVATLIEHSRQRQAKFLRGLSPRECNQLIALLERVQRNVEDQDR